MGRVQCADNHLEYTHLVTRTLAKAHNMNIMHITI